MTIKLASLTAQQIGLLNEALEPYGEVGIPEAWAVTDPLLRSRMMSSKTSFAESPVRHFTKAAA
jgi:hypothetical protein